MNSVREDPATRLAQANLAYAAQNADQGSLLSKPLANGGLNASNATTAAMQFAAQLNASNGQVTPLLFGNDASAGGDAGGSIAVRTAKTGVLVVDYAGKAGDVGVTFSKDQYMPNNAVKFNGAAEGTATTRRLKTPNSVMSADEQFADLQRKAKVIQEMVNPTLKASGKITSGQIQQILDKTTQPLKPYNKNANQPSFKAWDVEADKAAEANSNRTLAKVGFFVGGPTAIPATVVVLTAGGLPTASEMVTGAIINGTINAGAQKISDPNEKVNWIDVGGSAASGAFGVGRNLLQSVLINSETTMYTSVIQNQYPAAAVTGTVAGTTFGAGVDKSFDFASKYLPANNYTQPIKLIVPALKPVVSGAVGEFVSNYVTDKASQ